MKKITPLSEILRDLVEGAALGPDPAVLRLLEAWPGLLPEGLRPFVVLEGVREDVLVVTVSHPVAGQQMQFLREDLRRRVNQAVGRPLIRELRVKMGPLPPDEPARKMPVEKRVDQPRTLTRKEKGSIQRLAGEIKDAELRERVRALMEKSLALSPPESAGPRESKPRAVRKPSTPGGPSVPPRRS
ncbi:MAG: DUF721 domain-containing protein [Desulfobacterota bacterium]|jgi:hypothetical protein|nr:DUF721 domain-containing protein [Thermodesulfobacteriota bacterium]